jgi:hypothetical protein
MAFIPALAFLLLAVPAPAQQGQPADFEQLGQDLLRNIDAWTNQANGKLQSGKPVGGEDFDSLFGENFLSGSEDPLRDLELAQKRIDSKLSAAGRKEFDASYGSWMKKKVAPADLNPEVVSDDKHVTVNLDAPADAADSMKIDIAGGLIKMSYARQEQRRTLNPDGSAGTASFMKTRRRAMAVPKGANPAKYRVSAANGKVSIIFDRLKKGKARPEASK